jgi:hypothetical protein
MTETGFQDEFFTVRLSSEESRTQADIMACLQEYSDVQLTSYLANMTKSLATLNDVSRCTLLSI